MFCFLRLINGVLSEYVLAPQTHKGGSNVFFSSHDIDTDKTLVASCHSHPSGNYHPSEADLRTFRRKPINLILGNPFRITSMGVYDARGTPLSFDFMQPDEDFE